MSDADAYFESVDENLKSLAVKLRETVCSCSKEFSEEIKWNVPTYRIHKDICSIIVHKYHVNLQIFRGAELDAVDLLSGTGKSMRHLKYEAGADVETAVVKKVLRQAIALDCIL